MFINQRFLVYLIGFHALKEFFPDLAMKLILATPAKWIKKHCQWESWIETSWNCLDRETEDALEKVLAYIKTNLLLQQQSSTLSHMKLVDIGREAKICQRRFCIPWTLFWNARWVSSWPDLSSGARNMQSAAGGVTSLGWKLECSALQSPNPSVLGPSCFSVKEAEQLWSQCCNTNLHTWMACVHRRHGSCNGGSFIKFLLPRKHSNSKIIFISTGFIFWKVHIQNTIHSLTLKHAFDTHASARWMKSPGLDRSV